MRAAAWLAAVVLAAPTCAAARSWTHGGEATAGYDSNAGNAGTEDDRQGSGFLYASTSALWEQRYGGYTALQLRQTLAFEQWLRVEDLTSARYAVRLKLLHKPGRGWRTPVLALWGSAGARESVSDIRDGFDYRAGLSAAAPLTTAVQARLEASCVRRVATGGRAFDLDSSAWALDLDWRVAPRLLVYGGLRVEDGDFTVTARGFGIVEPKDEHLYLEPRASAIDADPAFGADWWAFRVEGATWFATAGLNLPLSHNLALDLQLLHGEAEMGRFVYVREVASVGLLVRW